MRIVVAGAGPAGAAIASRLATFGHDVTILAPSRRTSRIEGVSFRVLDALGAAGLADAVTALPSPVARRSCWNGTQHAAGEEWLVERDVFDARLRTAAHKFATVHDAHFIAAARDNENVRVAIKTGGSSVLLSADFLVDARGRGVPGRRLAGPQTVALCRRYRIGQALPSSTWLEAGANGWAWLAVPRDGDAYVQISTGSGRAKLPGRRALDAHFDLSVHDFSGVRERLRGAEPAGPVRARLATPGLSTEPVRARTIRAGDAAMAIDSLSGHGIFDAIAGALAAAAVVNTILLRPADAELARRFYEDRLTSTFRARALSGQAHYRREKRWPAKPFWTVRRQWPHSDEQVQQTQSAITRRPVIDGCWIRECDVIVTPQQPRGVWRFEGVPVVRLWEILTSGEADGPEAASKALGVSVRAAASAIDWLAQINLAGHRPLQRSDDGRAAPAP